MKKIIFALLITAVFLVFMGGPAQTGSAADKKILVAYFSLTGNTREIADQIHKIAGGDIFEIQPVEPYPTDYSAVLKVSKPQIDSGYKPPLKTKVEDINSYDVIFVGYPIWYGTFPPPVKTFLSEYDLSGKTVVPFCTHGGGGPGRSVADVSKLCPGSTLMESAAIMGGDVKNAQSEVYDWLRKIKLTKQETAL